MPGAWESGLVGGSGWGAARELPAKGQVVGVVLVESLVETTLASVSQSRLGSPPPLRGGSFTEPQRGQEKLGQAALSSRGQEHSPRLGRQGTTRTSESRVVRGRPAGRAGRAGGARPTGSSPEQAAAKRGGLPFPGRERRVPCGAGPRTGHWGEGLLSIRRTSLLLLPLLAVKMGRSAHVLPRSREKPAAGGRAEPGRWECARSLGPAAAQRSLLPKPAVPGGDDALGTSPPEHRPRRVGGGASVRVAASAW